MALGISLREFAKRDGCSDKVVRRAVASCALTTFEDGSLDERLVGTDWRKGNRNADTGADKRQTVRRSAPGADIVDELEPQAHGGALKRSRLFDDEDLGDPEDGDLDDAIRRLLSGEIFNLANAERLKANGLALRQLVNARREAGALVEIELAERVLFESARTIREAWLNWPARVGPELAADLDVPAEKVVELLTARVHDQLASLGDPSGDFTS